MPQILVDGQSRAWGRRADASARPTLLIEWQPLVTVGGAEVMRGGDCEFALNSLSVDSHRVHAGKIPAAAGVSDPPAGTGDAQADMPIFGAPHGYGYGQHDNPAVTDDGAWSFFANIKESVRRIMEDKAQSAYSHISTHLPTTTDQRIRAVYQREVVRRYNGGREFSWSGTAWQINPSLACGSDRLGYPNDVLGISVVYFTVGAGGTPACSWPIAFTSAQFGPGT